MSEHIDKQKAIDALADYIHNVDKVYSTGKLSADDCRNAAQSVLDDLPSAEEESFEWCDTCKEYDQEKHCCPRWSKIINQTVEEIRGTTAIGEWVKVHGFATPGGDPVWKCSNCGKGMHVYGIEHGTYGADIADHQWVACPNCGAIMIGERDG